MLKKAHVSVTDLAALTAKTGDEFAMFTLGSRRIIVRGSKNSLALKDVLTEKILSKSWKFSAHTHPGLNDHALIASGFPGDRQTLQLIGQERSLILNSVGRRSVFDIKNDYFISSESSHNSICPFGVKP